MGGELRFLGALHVDLLRHAELKHDAPAHEVFQTSTVQALLEGAFDGDVTLTEVLEHGDLGLGTLDGIDGELIVIDGEAWQARVDGSLVAPDPARTTPYAVVVPFAPSAPVPLAGPLGFTGLDEALGAHEPAGPAAIRIDGRFDEVRVRSVPRQLKPYPHLAEVIAQQQVTELHDVEGSMVGFRFPDPLGGIEIAGWHLHFATADRSRGGHVLGFVLRDAVALLDAVSALHVELPPAVAVAADGGSADQGLLRELETD
jgi:acetolactate decarboxylase